jgi:hypothetical protein
MVLPRGGAEARREQREEATAGPGGQLAYPVLLLFFSACTKASGRAPGARVAQEYQVDWVVHRQGAIKHTVAK